MMFIPLQKAYASIKSRFYVGTGHSPIHYCLLTVLLLNLTVSESNYGPSGWCSCWRGIFPLPFQIQPATTRECSVRTKLVYSHQNLQAVQAISVQTFSLSFGVNFWTWEGNQHVNAESLLLVGSLKLKLNLELVLMLLQKIFELS